MRTVYGYPWRPLGQFKDSKSENGGQPVADDQGPDYRGNPGRLKLQMMHNETVSLYVIAPFCSQEILKTTSILLPLFLVMVFTAILDISEMAIRVHHASDVVFMRLLLIHVSWEVLKTIPVAFAMVGTMETGFYVQLAKPAVLQQHSHIRAVPEPLWTL